MQIGTLMVTAQVLFEDWPLFVAPLGNPRSFGADLPG